MKEGCVEMRVDSKEKGKLKNSTSTQLENVVPWMGGRGTMEFRVQPREPNVEQGEGGAREGEGGGFWSGFLGETFPRAPRR
ncbi:hypothetical protein CEXT_790121 [Caerostris extrusa]|uniref:Uncharacterized protein n=1 Tax=Caerostris extrusa TaxID=172846 RepID=A0AAV4THA1_CAEEX|nr:hypothetical protein CEXT_790121 [Caerostris extrusa]